MKQILIIPTHSFVDVITNSSTELFVTSTDKTVEAVKEILKEKYDLARNLHFNPDAEYQTFEVGDVFDILSVRKATQKDIKYLKESWELDIKKDTILIEGTSDNSIPYEFFDIVENIFHAERHHLG
ncbi:MAG: hypothetical protein WC755_08480 [Candidatus Woesearchaeota archaeon]|jgi:hypothetical protein